MFGRKKWVNKILIEGEKEAQLVSRIENLKEVNPNFDSYPVDFKKAGRRTLWQAIKVSIEYSKHNMYNMFYKDDRINQGECR